MASILILWCFLDEIRQQTIIIIKQFNLSKSFLASVTPPIFSWISGLAQWPDCRSCCPNSSKAWKVPARASISVRCSWIYKHIILARKQCYQRYHAIIVKLPSQIIGVTQLKLNLLHSNDLATMAWSCMKNSTKILSAILERSPVGGHRHSWEKYLQRVCKERLGLL